MSLRDYVDILWRRKFVVLLVMLLGLLAVLAVGRPGEPDAGTYSGSLSLASDDPNAGTELLLLQQVAQRTSAIAERAGEIVGDDFYAQDFPGVAAGEVIRDTVGVTADPTVGTLQLVTEEQPTAEAVELVLVAYGQSLVEFDRGRRQADIDEQLDALVQREQSLRQRIDELEAEIDRLTGLQSEEDRDRGLDPDRVLTAQLGSNVNELTNVLAEIAALENLTEGELTILRQIGAPEVVALEPEASPLDYGQRLLVGLGLATVLGVGLAFALHRFDGKLYNRKENETAFGLPVLAEIPYLRWWSRRRRDLVSLLKPSSAIAERYRLLRSGLAHARGVQVAQLPDGVTELGAVVLVTSVSAQVGKTTTVANLAVASVDAGRAVLVVSADLREPTLHRHFAVDPPIGITDAVAGLGKTGRPQLEPFLIPTGVDGITMLGHGDEVSNPGETLARLSDLMPQAREQFDLILVDSPPMLVGNDVSEMIPFVDLVLLVSRAGRTTEEEAQWAEEMAARLDAPLCGLVLIGARPTLNARRGSRLARAVRWLRRRSSRSQRSYGRGAAAAPVRPPAGLPPAEGPTRAGPARQMPVAPIERPDRAPAGSSHHTGFASGHNDRAAPTDAGDNDFDRDGGAIPASVPADDLSSSAAPVEPASAMGTVTSELEEKATDHEVEEDLAMGAQASLTVEISGPPPGVNDGEEVPSGSGASFRIVEFDSTGADEPPRSATA